jgi:RimJ/RimL family protein N-acetyltransferase
VTPLPHVRLRPLVPDDAAALEAGYTETADPYNWAGHRDAGWMTVAIEERRTLTDERGDLAVVDESDALLGDVSYYRVQTGPSKTSSCWAIGISLLPEHRGRGFGAAAQRELARYLFRTTAAERVEADTAADNVAEQRALERAGFVREGVRRSYQWRDGAWHDSVVFAVVRGEL